MGTDEHTERTSHMNILGWSPYRFATVLFVGMGVLWGVLGGLIVMGGDVFYGSLYSITVVVSWLIAYFFWRMEQI